MPFIVPIIGAIAAGIGTVGTFLGGLGVIGTALLGAGAAVAVGYLQQALMGTPDDTSSSQSVPAGVNFQRQYGENVARTVPCGIVGIAGHDVYVNTYSNANNELQQVYVLGDYYSSGLQRVAISGEWQTLGDVADPVKGFPITSGAWANLIWVKFLDGRQTTADAGLVANANPSDRWDETCVGVGETAVIISMTYDQDRNNSFPDFFFEFKGAPLYDWRKDTSVGGSGSHRWNDVTTHEFSDNPIVIEYNYRRGFSINDDLFCGMGMPAGDLPLDKFTLAASICDENVDGETRYRCSIFLDCMTQHGDNLKSIALSCGALQVDGVDGSWPIVGSDQPSVITFTDDDLIDGASFKWRRYRSMGDLVNSVSGNYPDPFQMWSMVGYEAQTSSDLVTVDRRTRDVSIDFPQVSSPRQAAQLAWIYLYENRFERTGTVTLRPRFQTIETGDWVRWNSARYGDHTYLVNSTNLAALEADGPRNITLDLQERDGQIYDGVSPPLQPVPLPPGEPVYSTEVDSFAVVPASVVGDGGRAQPALRVSWATVIDTTVTSVEIRYYPTANPDAVISKIVNPSVTVHFLSEGVVGATNYTTQCRIVTTPARTTVFNAGVTVKTLNIQIAIGDIDSSIFDQLNTLEGSLRDQIDTMNTRISQMLINNTARTWNDRKAVRTDLIATYGTAIAEISDVRTVAVDTQTALAEFETTATAAIGENTASISTIGTVVADLDSWASASYSIVLDVNGYHSSMKAYNGGPGQSAFIFTTNNFQVAITGTSGTAVPVFTVGTINSVTNQVGIRGNLVIDGTITAKALAVTRIDAITGNFGVMTAGKLQDPLGLMVFDLDNLEFYISEVI